MRMENMWQRSAVNLSMLLICLGWLAFSGFAFAIEEESGNLLNMACKLKEDGQESEALALFEKILKKEPENYQALLTAAYLHFRQGWLHSEHDQRREHYRILQLYSRKALALKPTEYAARLLAIVGKAKTARYLSPGEQVRVARELREDLAALSVIRPDDPDCVYVLSWLNFKVGKTSALEKFVASVFFGGLPEDLTIENAFALMHKVMQLRPGYIVYVYDLGLFSQRLGEPEKASSWYEKVLTMEAKTAEDVVYKAWAQQRLLELHPENASGN